jgi:hypothetical protein
LKTNENPAQSGTFFSGNRLSLLDRPPIMSRPWAGWRPGLAILALALVTAVGAAQEATQAPDVEPADFIDWYYGAAFGTGVYRVGDKTAAVFRIPLSYTLRPVEGKRWGVRLLFPVTFGLYDFGLSRVFRRDLVNKIGTVSVLPGAEFQVPVREDWLLKPFAQFGAGKELSSGGGALIYAVGLRSRTLWRRERTEFTLGGELKHAGYRTNANFVSSLSRVGLGGDLVVPMNKTLKGYPLNLGMQMIYYRYFNDFDSLAPDLTGARNQEIRDELEVGFMVGTYKPLKVMGLELERLGLGFTFGEDLRGVKLLTGFPF